MFSSQAVVRSSTTRARATGEADRRAVFQLSLPDCRTVTGEGFTSFEQSRADPARRVLELWVVVMQIGFERARLGP